MKKYLIDLSPPECDADVWEQRLSYFSMESLKVSYSILSMALMELDKVEIKEIPCCWECLNYLRYIIGMEICERICEPDLYEGCENGNK